MAKDGVGQLWRLPNRGGGRRSKPATGPIGTGSIYLGPSSVAGTGSVGGQPGTHTGTGAFSLPAATVYGTNSAGNTINVTLAQMQDPAQLQTVINNASAGSTLQLPAGDVTWESMVTVNKGLYIKGAGVGQTIIRDNVTKNGGSSSSLMALSCNHPERIWISDITFASVAASDPNNVGHMRVGGTQREFRFFDCSILSNASAFIRSEASALGVISSITMSQSVQAGLLLALPVGWGHLSHAPGTTYGDGSWGTPLWWGNDSGHGFDYPPQWFIEDCVITKIEGVVKNAFDGLDGARAVLRHNTFDGTNVSSHGTDSGGRRRGIRQMEIYNNTFILRDPDTNDFCIWIRSGTGVVFGNVVQNLGGAWRPNTLVKTTNCRDADGNCGGPSYSPWGACNGGSGYDGNTNSTGYPCVDQPGRGKSNNLAGVETPPVEWVGNEPDPIRVWSNTATVGTGETGVGTLASGSTNVESDRDFYVSSDASAERSGYTPYAHPHPIRSTSF